MSEVFEVGCYEHRWNWDPDTQIWTCANCEHTIAKLDDPLAHPCVLCGAPRRWSGGLCPACRKRAEAVTEIERAACTLLVKHGFIHDPIVLDYVRHITADPDFCEYPGTGEGLQFKLHDIDHANEEQYPDREYWFCMLDKAAYNLALNVAGYRRSGRPTGDQTTEIGGGFQISSSLAANVVEYHHAVVNAWATGADHKEGELRTKLIQAQRALA